MVVSLSYSERPDVKPSPGRWSPGTVETRTPPRGFDGAIAPFHPNVDSSCMALLHGISARLAIIELECPSCGERQARARDADPNHRYRCKRCHKLMDPSAAASKDDHRKTR